MPSSIFIMKSSSSSKIWFGILWTHPMWTEFLIFWALFELKSAIDSLYFIGEAMVCRVLPSILNDSTVQNSLFERMFGYSLMIWSLMLFGDCHSPSLSMKEDLMTSCFCECRTLVSNADFYSLVTSCCYGYIVFEALKLLGVLPLEPSSSNTGTLGDKSWSKG